MSTRNQNSHDHDAVRRSDACAAADSVPTNAIKNPDDWKTGDESMTGAQASYLETLAEEAGESVDQDLTKAEASKKIDELQSRTGRGIDH